MISGARPQRRFSAIVVSTIFGAAYYYVEQEHTHTQIAVRPTQLAGSYCAETVPRVDDTANRRTRGSKLAAAARALLRCDAAFDVRAST